MFKSAASLIEACLVTEVREYGEIVTAIRLEYDEEVCCRSLTNYICHAQSLSLIHILTSIDNFLLTHLMNP